MNIVQTKSNPNTTFIPTDPTTINFYKNAPVSVGVIMSSSTRGGAGFEFQLGSDNFYFWTRLDYGGFKVGLSVISFGDADANATSTVARLTVGKLDVTASYVGNSGSINVGPL